MSSLVLNGIDLTTFSDTQLKELCLKYKIASPTELRNFPRDRLLQEIKQFLKFTMNKYKGRRLSQPNLINPNKGSGPPQSAESYTRDRRMSHPITPNEIKAAQESHTAREAINAGKQEIRQMKQTLDMKQCDQLGMYPSVRRLVAIGDLHGDLKVTLQALRLAKVIPRDIYPNNVDQIRWIGGDTWVVQCGDQIDRCRPGFLE